MAEAAQWAVTYTKQVAKKRKIYHDGILVIKCCSANQKKALLYDEFGKLVDSRFLKRHENIECGQSFEFDSILVDVGNAIEKETHFLDVTNQERDMKIIRKNNLWKRVNRYTKVSQEKEVQRMGMKNSQNVTDSRDASIKEWYIVYTKQKAQKTKKYHDGILQLVLLGSQQKQVRLSSEDGKVLEKKCISCLEDVISGSTLEFEEYLVEVGEPKVSETHSKPCMRSLIGSELTLESQPAIQERQSMRRDSSHVTDKENSFSNDASPKDAGNIEINIFGQEFTTASNGSLSHANPMKAGSVFVKEGLRNVNQILTNLKKPVTGEGIFFGVQDAESNLNGSKLSTSRELHLPDIQVEIGKEATQSTVSDKENFSRHDACSHHSSLKLSEDVHVEKSLSVGNSSSQQFQVPQMLSSGKVNNGKNILECKKGWSLEASSSLLIPSKKLSIRPARHFQAPKLEFNVNLQDLVFPENANSLKFRQVVIPDEFSSVASYRRIMSSAVYEEINLTLCDIANDFHKAKDRLSGLNKRRPLCKHGKAQLQIVKKDGPNKGRLFYGCSSQIDSCLFAWADASYVETSDSKGFQDWSNEELEHAFSCFNIDFYTQCEIFTRKTKDFFPKKKKCNEYDCGEENVGVNKTSIFLRLQSSKNDKRSCHSKGDLWIISSNANLIKEKRDDFVAFVVSNYHGPSSHGVLEVEFLGSKVPIMPCKNVYALHGPYVQCELAMLNVLRNLLPQSMPLLPLILHYPKTPFENCPSQKVEKMANDFIEKYILNEDQAKVLHFVAKWFIDSCSLSTNPEICLVHGIFGSGKSHLLAIVIILLTSVLKMCKEQTRILISAATNVAVDRVLTSLLELGFNDFIRVGSIKRIARNILPYSVHTVSDTDSVDDVTLGDMGEWLGESSVHEGLKMEHELKCLMDGKMAKRRDKVKVVQVVGVTCYSTTNPSLKGSKFQICLLDECSQIPEPLSLLPISLFGCSKLIAVGDPAQLPPTLLGGSGLGEMKDSETAGDQTEHTKKVLCEEDEKQKTKEYSSFHDLRRALFVRLMEMGYEPVLLRTQYRCHPRLIDVPNDLFYGGKIKSGCREIDRPPLLSGLPTLLFWDTLNHGSEIKDSSKSYSNPYEAKIACELINMLLEHGIHGSQIGVIVLYKSQASLVQELVSQGCSFRRVKRVNKNVILDNQCVKKSIYKDQYDKAGSLVDGIQISTVDAFQGMEKNIIILSCCRTNGLGFLSSPNRLNVALTRARHHLIIIGKASNLRRNPLWEKLLSNAMSTSGSYISTPASGPEFIRNSMQDLISGKDPCSTTDLRILSSNERTDAVQDPDICIPDAQSRQYDNEKKSTMFRQVHSQCGTMAISDVCQVAGLYGEAAADNNNSLCAGMKKKRMVKNGTELDDKESACTAKGYNSGLQMTIVEELQTAEPSNGMHASQILHKSWSNNTVTWYDVNGDVVPLEDKMENHNKKPNCIEEGDFQHAEATNFLLDNQSNPSIYANLPPESDKPICLLPSVSTANFGPGYSESSFKRESSEMKLTDGLEPLNGSVDAVIKTIAVRASEDTGNGLDSLHEVKDCAESSDMEMDDFAPTFNLGF